MAAAPTKLRLRVAPGATRSEVVGRHGEAWKVRVTAPPEDGKANEAVLRLLAEALSLPRAALAIVAGHGTRDKLVEADGLGSEAIDRRLRAADKSGSA